MANKRMFSLQIVDTDAFLDMPAGSQLLYFHLVMRADDEGFVANPKKILRLVGSQEDDFKILVAKRFILTFESGVIVIKHWFIHNTIRMDRFHKTVYTEEKNGLETKGNKAYTELATSRQPSGRHLVPQVKLSKVKLSKSSSCSPAVNEPPLEPLDEPLPLTPFELFWNSYPRKQGKLKAEEKFIEALKITTFEKIMETLTKYKNSKQWQDKQFVPMAKSWLFQERWDDEVEELTLMQIAEQIMAENVALYGQDLAGRKSVSQFRERYFPKSGDQGMNPYYQVFDI